MDCNTAHKLIQEYLDGALEPQAEKDFAAHTALCPECARELESYRMLEQMLGGRHLEPVPEGFAEPVIRFLRATGRIRTRRARPAGFLGWIPARLRIPALASVCVIVALSVISVASGKFLGVVGEGTVAATNTFVEVQKNVSTLSGLDNAAAQLGKDMRMAKTLAGALYAVLFDAGRTYFFPALLMLVALALGALWYIRTSARRSTGHASFCF